MNKVYVEIPHSGAELTKEELNDFVEWMAWLLKQTDPGDTDDVPGTFSGRDLALMKMRTYANFQDLGNDVAGIPENVTIHNSASRKRKLMGG